MDDTIRTSLYRAHRKLEQDLKEIEEELTASNTNYQTQILLRRWSYTRDAIERVEGQMKDSDKNPVPEDKPSFWHRLFKR